MKLGCHAANAQRQLHQEGCGSTNHLASKLRKKEEKKEKSRRQDVGRLRHGRAGGSKIFDPLLCVQGGAHTLAANTYNVQFNARLTLAAGYPDETELCTRNFAASKLNQHTD